MKFRIFLSVALLLALAAPTLAWADAAGDLAAGRTALEAGEFDKAENLLSAAAQALPNSVEAQLALADCYVKLGDLEKALARYRAVLKISPEHVAAKRIVAALTGERTSFDEQLAAARALIEAGVHPAAEGLLRRLVLEPIEPAQRTAAKLLLAEAQLWNNATPGALTDALRVIQESQDAKLTGPARVIAALALLSQADPQTAKAADLLKQAGEVAAAWAARAALAKTLLQLDDASKGAENSTSLIASLAAIPAGPYRNVIVDRATKALVATANARLGQGDSAAAVSIVWPMVSAQAVPGVDAVLKPVDATGGWLPKSAFGVRFQVASILAATGRLESERSGAAAKLLGYWLASETLRQTASDELSANELVKLAVELAGQSRPAHDRKPGTTLSVADSIQRAVLLQAAARAVNDPVRQQVAELVLAHVARYEQANDLETGFAQFVTSDAAAKPIQVKLAAELSGLPPGVPHSHLVKSLGERAAQLGLKAFQASIATLSPDANTSLNKFDAAAVSLYSITANLYPLDPNSNVAAAALIDRYAAASKWGAATEAATLYYGAQNGEAIRWALVVLKVRQAMYAEDRLLAANRQLGKELSPQVKEILADALKVIEAYPGKSSKQSAANVAERLVVRYAELQRIDLAEAVIAAASAAPAGAPLADWALWTRAGLFERQAAQALLLASGQNEADIGPALHDMHKAELAILSDLMTKHPQSEYLSACVERVVHIANLYQNYRSFDVARAVIADFLKAQPKLAAAERLEYQSVQIALDKARLLFSERKDKVKAPEKLSDEFVAALDALAAYLKAHPTGDHAPAAEGELLAIARTYGEVGAWQVSRDVLNRLAAAVPDFSSPSHLKFLQAATYIGELDRAYGLSLLTPVKKPNAAVTGEGSASAVAATPPPTPEATAANTKKTNKPRPGSGSGAGGGLAGGGFGGVGGPGGGGIPGLPGPDANFFKADPSSVPSGKPSESALAMIRQSQQRQFQQIAMLEEKLAAKDDKGKEGKQEHGDQAVALPSGPVLSEAEMKRQDVAADKAYAILIELVKSPSLADASVAAVSRAQVLWLFGFFEGQLRHDRAIVYIKKYLVDRPTEPARIALALQAINDQLAWAEERQPTVRVNQAWFDQRHARFEEARKEIAAFIKAQAGKPEYTQQARLLAVDSYDREAQLAAAVSSVRAGGLLVQGAEALLALLDSVPNHAEKGNFPARLWNLADRLCGYGQEEQAIFVLSQIPIRFPIDGHANQAVLRIAQLHATHLANPLRALETYQEYLSLAGDDESVRAHIYNIAQQLAAKQRYVESLHVYGVFVDSFPTDPRAAEALRAIGQTHQTNEVWEEAIATYQRILDEYPGVPTLPQVKLAMAECHINLSHWRTARDLYEEYATQHPQDPQTPMVQARMVVLKNLDKFENLLADNEVQRNKDDAQFQIGRIVQEQLQNPVKAVAEFRKVVSKYPKSDIADDAQLEIGKSLLALGRLDDARKELLQVPGKFPNSPLADDALFLIGQSYEQQGLKLASITIEKARAEAFEQGQRGAYRAFNAQVAGRGGRLQQRRDDLKKSGDFDALALDEAKNAASELNFLQGGIANTARFAEQQAETESAIEVANRQDRINDAYREAVAMYMKSVSDYPLGDKTDESLLKIAQIFETHLKDRAAAMQTYQRIVKLFPGTPVAEDAAWKVAQFHEREAKYTAAAEAYRDFIRNYPGSARVADAQFALAEVLEQLGNWVDAMDAYETFRQKFGSHPKATLAMEQINWIKAYRK